MQQYQGTVCLCLYMHEGWQGACVCARARAEGVHTLEVVEVGVLCHSAVEERPGEVVNCVLLVLHRLGHHLRVEMVMQEVVQIRLQITTD